MRVESHEGAHGDDILIWGGDRWSHGTIKDGMLVFDLADAGKPLREARGSAAWEQEIELSLIHI